MYKVKIVNMTNRLGVKLYPRMNFRVKEFETLQVITFIWFVAGCNIEFKVCQYLLGGPIQLRISIYRDNLLIAQNS